VLAEQGIGAQLCCHCGATRREGALPAFSALLASADHALQRSRERGDNQYEIELFDEADARGSLDWRATIERAIDEHKIVLFGQAVLGFPGRTPVHSEVTVRMAAERGEPIPAAQFLPMAARHGLIARIDCHVAEMLLGHLARRAAPLPMFALNVSARTIAEPEAARRLLELLDGKSDLASRLVFEMTEFGALQDPRRAEQFGLELRHRGARFAIDNFSMHQNSLMLVHALKPDYIKLSPAYTGELAGNAHYRFFVASLVRIARSLDIGIFAQAVEDESLIPLLEELGLSGYQGFAGGRPGPMA
jgi:EAL domain-containing protein (putative c-di-GMP-specific phosphodiesterase class I)